MFGTTEHRIDWHRRFDNGYDESMDCLNWAARLVLGILADTLT